MIFVVFSLQFPILFHLGERKDNSNNPITHMRKCLPNKQVNQNLEQQNVICTSSNKVYIGKTKR